MENPTPARNAMRIVQLVVLMPRVVHLVMVSQFYPKTTSASAIQDIIKIPLTQVSVYLAVLTVWLVVIHLLSAPLALVIQLSILSRTSANATTDTIYQVQQIISIARNATATATLVLICQWIALPVLIWIHQSILTITIAIATQDTTLQLINLLLNARNVICLAKNARARLNALSASSTLR